MHIFLDHFPKCATLFNGNDKSPCPLPCTTFQIRKKIISAANVKNKGDPHEGRIRLLFSSNVQVSRTDFVKPTLTRLKLKSNLYFINNFNILTSLLAEVGGSMGLWLGLGVVQALQVTVTCVKWIGRFGNTGAKE